MKRRRITEYLDLDLDEDLWYCNRCSKPIISAHRNYKEGLLLYERHPWEIHFPFGPEKRFNYAPDPDWCRIIEFYCPHCGTMFETEYLPPGHPITHDIELDLTSLKAKLGRDDLRDHGLR